MIKKLFYTVIIIGFLLLVAGTWDSARNERLLRRASEMNFNDLRNEVALIKDEILYKLNNVDINELKASLLRLGADNIKFFAGQKYRLAGSGISSSASSITLQSLTVPVSGYEVAMTDFGTVGYATLEPGTSKREFISFTGISQNAANTEATLSGVLRGLSFVSPYTASTTLQQAHSGGSILVFSNPPQLYNEAAFKNNDESIIGTWSFSSTSQPVYDAATTFTNPLALVNKSYADALAFQGVATATEVTIGAVMLATNSQGANGTATSSSGAPLVMLSRNAGATYYAASSSIAVVTGSSNKIDANFIATSSAYTWSGLNIFSGSPLTISSATTTLSSATTTFTNINSILGIGTSTPSIAMGLSIGKGLYVSGGVGIGVATSTANPNLTINNNLIVNGSATTTNITISGTQTGGTWSYTGSSTPYVVTAGTLTSTGSIPADANFGIVVYAISSASDMNSTALIARVGATVLSIRREDAGSAAQYSFTWSGNNLEIAEVVDNASQVSGTVYWYR